MTAIEFIHEIAKQREPDKFDWEEAKKLERQQIIDANRAGVDMVIDKKPFIIGEQYYNETYGSKGSDELSKDAKNTSFDTSSQTEISDEEIEKAANELYQKGVDIDYRFIMGAKWAINKLKNK